MTLISADDFDEIFTGFRHTADRLEVRDRYSDPVEDEALRRWLAGEPDDLAWMKPWLDQVSAQQAAGQRYRRVRVVSVPLSDYQRWGLLAISHLNVAAGEDIRYLDRRQAADLPGFDYWLFDDGTADAKAVEVRFDAVDGFLGGKLLDPALIPELSTAFQLAHGRASTAAAFAEVHRHG